MADLSMDPADLGDLSGCLRAVFRKQLQNVDVCLPAVVVAYDRATNRATVKPMIQLVATDDTLLGRSGVADVPVYQFGGGGMMLAFNIKPGNLGWLIASDRDISLYMQGGVESKPNTLRMHSFSDAVFLPDRTFDFSINKEDSENAVLQTTDGNIRVALASDHIKLTAGEVSLTVSASGVAIEGGTVTHNGTNIGDTHIHSQGADSHGDSEVDTGGPHS